MPITPRSGGYQVRVNFSKALKGYRRVSCQVSTLEEAQKKEKEIRKSLDIFGKWPIEEGDRPLAKDTDKASVEKGGTLRKAVNLSLEYHWGGTEYGEILNKQAPGILRFFHSRGVYDIDDITSEDTDAFITHLKAIGNAPSTINKKISFLSVVSQEAIERDPPLASKLIKIKKLKEGVQEKWWLRPEDQEKASKWLRSQNEELFADYIDLVCLQGFRIKEMLAVEHRHCVDLYGDSPQIKVPGTKTQKSQATLPVYRESIPILRRSYERAEANGWKNLFPMTYQQAATRWNTVREYLGVSEVKTATLKSLRRTFAWYANKRRMTTSDLKRVMRHNNITTTEGYLDLVGANDLEYTRSYFEEDETPQTVDTASTSSSSVGDMIRHYRESGATPEEVARFAKEIMG
ncbi:MAG: site-specific integrase [Rhizobiaceae bacterium]|nr:site-specific integrase [Rhizobiaceae bacterium]